MDIPHVYKFKADNVISIMSGAWCSLGKAVDVKHSRENCEQAQNLKHYESILLHNYRYRPMMSNIHLFRKLMRLGCHGIIIKCNKPSINNHILCLG
jgi:hypothetical protein